MHFIWENLNNALHQVFLGNSVTTRYNLFKYLIIDRKEHDINIVGLTLFLILRCQPREIKYIEIILTPGSTADLYIAKSMLSNWDNLTRLVPTRIRSSILSLSFFSRSLLWPWCCMRTHNLFISAKFRRIKSIESSTFKEESRYNTKTTEYWVNALQFDSWSVTFYVVLPCHH